MTELMPLFVAVVVAIQGVTVAIIGRESKQRKAHEKKQEDQAKLRAEESRLSMALMSANASLGVATAIAVRDKKTNGEMSDALKEAHSAKREYYAFINGVASTKVTAD